MKILFVTDLHGTRFFMHSFFRRHYIFLGLLLIFCLGGVVMVVVAARPVKILTRDTPEKLSLSQLTQNAVFRIGLGWTGGMGSMPVLEMKNDQVKKWDGLPIYLDENFNTVISSKTPPCVVGTPFVKVSARIKFEERSEINGSMPIPSTETYYTARVLELYDVFVEAINCDEE